VPGPEADGRFLAWSSSCKSSILRSDLSGSSFGEGLLTSPDPAVRLSVGLDVTRRWLGLGNSRSQRTAGQETTARTREKRSSGSQRCPKNYWCRSRRFSISAISPASHSLATDHCSRATACVLWLRFRRPGSGTDDSTSSRDEPCVDSGLASFCTFSGVFTPEGRLCRSQSPWYGRPVASIPSWDKIPIVSFVESSMTRLESCPTIRPWLTSGVGWPLSPSPHPPDLTSHPSSAVRHPSSAI